MQWEAVIRPSRLLTQLNKNLAFIQPHTLFKTQGYATQRHAVRRMPFLVPLLGFLES